MQSEEIAKIKVLLIQTREGKMKDHEFLCVVEKSGLRSDQIVAWNIFDKLIAPADLEGFDALFVGGAGGHCITEGTIKKEVAAIEEVIREARRREMPTLGLCFGAQVMAQALGGSLVHDRERQETGTFVVTRSGASEFDPVLQKLPKEFQAVLGHKDHISHLPHAAVHLGESKLSPFQAFTFPNEPIYGFQFHPELDRAGMVVRMNYYRDLYLQTEIRGKGFSAEEEELDRIEKESVEVPDAVKIVKIFIEEVVVGGKRYPSFPKRNKVEKSKKKKRKRVCV